MPGCEDARPARLHALARDYPDGFIVGEHAHVAGQFIHATAGVMEIRAARHLWLVPPQRGLWIPPRLAHAFRARGCVSLRTLYIAPGPDASRLGSATCGFTVPMLLRALILRMLDPPVIGDERRQRRLATVLLDELANLERDGLSLPMPSDPRLARICAGILARPGDAHRIDEGARHAGASIRTLARLSRDELGCPLSAWRQQARVLSAVPMLIAGEPVTRIAQTLGYETTGAFSAMFGRLVGMSPRAYQRSYRVSQHDLAEG